MTDVIRVHLKNHVHLKIEADPGILMEMRDHFSFRVDGYQYMPAYKQGRWDGYIRLLDGRTNELYAGLYDKILEFANARGRDYVVEPVMNTVYGMPGVQHQVNFDEITEWVRDMQLVAAGGKDIDPHDFQLTALADTIRDRRKVIISPTRSGKSLIIYLLIRYIMEFDPDFGDKQIALIVPRTSLVKQMLGDFKEYSSKNGWDADKYCHIVTKGGKDHDTKKPIIISTWQSFIKFPRKVTSNIHAIFGDEAHNFKAMSLTSIMEKLHNAPWRIGLTGTLDGSKVNKMVLEGLFGPVQTMTTTKALMDRGIIAKLDITVLMLKYGDLTRKAFGKKKYHDEIAFINSHQRRNNFIRNLALSLEGNTILAFTEIAHGELLHDLITAKAHENRQIYLVNGGTATDDREAIRKIVETQKNAIIIASLGVFAEGITIRNLHNVIFARPTKSQVKVLQMLGRSLGLSDDGRPSRLFDIADDLSWGKRANYTLKHCAERIKMYIAEKHKYKIVQVELEK